MNREPTVQQADVPVIATDFPATDLDWGLPKQVSSEAVGGAETL